MLSQSCISDITYTLLKLTLSQNMNVWHSTILNMAARTWINHCWQHFKLLVQVLSISWTPFDISQWNITVIFLVIALLNNSNILKFYILKMVVSTVKNKNKFSYKKIFYSNCILVTAVHKSLKFDMSYHNIMRFHF